MGTKHFRALAVVTSAVLLMFIGNAAEAGGRNRFRTPITLTSPAADVVITQNDPAIGCSLNASRGYGFRIVFDWTSPPLKNNGSTYTLQLQHVGAVFPITLDGLTTTTYDLTDCNTFVIDSNLSNWYWTVSYVRANGTVGYVTEQRPFRFAPCRLSTGEACNAPPGS